MNLQYLTRNIDLGEISHEGLVLRTNYLFAQSSHHYSSVGFYIYLFTNKYDNESSLRFANTIISESNKRLENLEVLENNLKYIKRLRNTKNKSKAQLIEIQKWNKFAEESKNICRKWADSMLANCNLNNLTQLFDNQIIKGYVINLYEEANIINTNEEDIMMNFFCYSFFNSDTNFFLYYKDLSDKFKIKQSDINNSEISNTETFDFYSLSLFKFTGNLDLTAEQMKLIRNQFSIISNTISEKINSFNKKIEDLTSHSELINEITSFRNDINPDLTDIQHLIDENIYFRKIINSNENNIVYSYEMAICNYLTIIDYYEKNNTILSFVASNLKKQIEQFCNPNQFIIVFYLKPIN